MRGCMRSLRGEHKKNETSPELENHTAEKHNTGERWPWQTDSSTGRCAGIQIDT
jgi:hypothetical protein